MSRLPKLTELIFNADNYAAQDDGPFVTDRCVTYLARSNSLRSISIHDAGHLSSNFVDRLANRLPALERLKLSGYDAIDNDGFKALARHSKLKQLAMPDLLLSNAQFCALRTPPSLEALQIEGRYLSEATLLEVLTRSPNLKRLRVSLHNSDLQQLIDRALMQE